ncbi:sialin-like isoform X2 [Penaeus monodon]|uniref:sialin-like isoform X2 n=1 Tax=Penaeus monodon TaxID=6687 RepID=UPI0018A75A82|nr:sialin-like isoform X2 [Penaeus monodon]
MSTYSWATTAIIAAATAARNSRQKSGKRESPQTRYVLVSLGMVGVAVDYFVRYSISVAIVAMVKTHSVATNTTHDKGICPAAVNITVKGGVDPHAKGEYDWSEQMTGVILGMFFWGYFITKAAGGRIAELMGARRTMAASLGASGVLSLLCPTAASIHPLALAGLRLAMGLVQGPAFPALYSLLSRWSPPDELATMVSVAFSGEGEGRALRGGMVFEGIVCSVVTVSGLLRLFLLLLLLLLKLMSLLFIIRSSSLLVLFRMITSKRTHEHKVPRYEGPKESLTTLIFRDQPDQLLAPVNQSPSGCLGGDWLAGARLVRPSVEGVPSVSCPSQVCSWVTWWLSVGRASWWSGSVGGGSSGSAACWLLHGPPCGSPSSASRPRSTPGSRRRKSVSWRSTSM